MLTLLMRGSLLTILLAASSLVFAERVVLSALVLAKIAITAVWLVIGDRTPTEENASAEPPGHAVVLQGDSLRGPSHDGAPWSTAAWRH